MRTVDTADRANNYDDNDADEDGQNNDNKNRKTTADTRLRSLCGGAPRGSV